MILCDQEVPGPCGTDPGEHGRVAGNLMAEGHSNARIARGLVVRETAVGKHIGSIMAKPDLTHEDVDVNRRVKAVPAFLRA